ncbi:hypothetical protein PRIPAC_97213 [Pristionchus pacificus]|uniref:Uncharacterized protein n=1 Tax=Pristionchus pacificus TaxID=54126 RepID=A0A2A6D1N9_PRIPA|nr:hypothetical protein PRIPAC_97213 [Pristionchus pacificus]|eukprot:PDM84309.1 hypothetical protein PRIPAC_33332 [Pristionchus pacificus]
MILCKTVNPITGEQQKGIGATPMIFPDLVQKFGNTFGLYVGPELEIITTAPTIIKEVLISQFSNFIDRRRLNINMAYPMLDGLLQVDHKGRYGTF